MYPKLCYISGVNLVDTIYGVYVDIVKFLIVSFFIKNNHKVSISVSCYFGAWLWFSFGIFFFFFTISRCYKDVYAGFKLTYHGSGNAMNFSFFMIVFPTYPENHNTKAKPRKSVSSSLSSLSFCSWSLSHWKLQIKHLQY